LLDFEHSILGKQEPKAVARQTADRNIDQIRRDIYDSHRHRTFALAYYMTGNELAAEDLLVRCFTRAFASKAAPDGGDVDASLLEELRADGVLGELEVRDAPEPGAALQPRGNILRTDLEEALRELPSVERLIFLLSDVEGYPAAAIARLMDRPEAEVARSLMGARLRLRQAVAALQKRREHAA
jgi:RNA polymerase sigma-70 factor (ECF subfamily)